MGFVIQVNLHHIPKGFKHLLYAFLFCLEKKNKIILQLELFKNRLISQTLVNIMYITKNKYLNFFGEASGIP